MGEKYKYPLPVNFDSNNPEFDIFKDVPNENMEACSISEYENVRISNDSVIFRYFKVFKESCFGEGVYQYAQTYKFFLKYIFPKINLKRNKTFILITDQWTSNYYHWHLYSLIKLVVLKKKNLIKDAIFIIPKSHHKTSFVVKSLSNFGIKSNQISVLRRKSNIKVKKLLFPQICQNNLQEIKELYNILQKNIKKTISFGERIYISRNKTGWRYVENETELLKIITKYNFKIVHMQDYSYEDQISISAHAKYIIGPHGAGLTNILFMKKGGYLLELCAKPLDISLCKPKPITDYCKLSSFIGMNYFYQECLPSGEPTIWHDHQKSFFVDCKRLKQNLDLMLQSNINSHFKHD